jgi:hypothetical protein
MSGRTSGDFKNSNGNRNPQMTPMKSMIAPGICSDYFSGGHWEIL